MPRQARPQDSDLDSGFASDSGADSDSGRGFETDTDDDRLIRRALRGQQRNRPIQKRRALAGPSAVPAVAAPPPISPRQLRPQDSDSDPDSDFSRGTETDVDTDNDGRIRRVSRSQQRNRPIQKRRALAGPSGVPAVAEPPVVVPRQVQQDSDSEADSEFGSGVETDIDSDDDLIRGALPGQQVNQPIQTRPVLGVPAVAAPPVVISVPAATAVPVATAAPPGLKAPVPSSSSSVSIASRPPSNFVTIVPSRPQSTPAIAAPVESAGTTVNSRPASATPLDPALMGPVQAQPTPAQQDGAILGGLPEGPRGGEVGIADVTGLVASEAQLGMQADGGTLSPGPSTQDNRGPAIGIALGSVAAMCIIMGIVYFVVRRCRAKRAGKTSYATRDITGPRSGGGVGAEQKKKRTFNFFRNTFNQVRTGNSAFNSLSYGFFNRPVQHPEPPRSKRSESSILNEMIQAAYAAEEANSGNVRDTFGGRLDEKQEYDGNRMTRNSAESAVLPSEPQQAYRTSTNATVRGHQTKPSAGAIPSYYAGVSSVSLGNGRATVGTIESFWGGSVPTTTTGGSLSTGGAEQGYGSSAGTLPPRVPTAASSSSQVGMSTLRGSVRTSDLFNDTESMTSGQYATMQQMERGRPRERTL